MDEKECTGPEALTKKAGPDAWAKYQERAPLACARPRGKRSVPLLLESLFRPC